MFRTLAHYWRVNLAVTLGAAVAAAVLSGALLVGDSIRGSLRALTLDRLGSIESALVGQRFFREELAHDLGVAPAIVVRGSLVHADSGRRASGAGIQGVDSRFTALYGTSIDFDREPGQVFPSIVVNEALGRELQAQVGDALLLSFGRHSEVPRETLMGEKDPDDVLGTLRVQLKAVLPDSGLGRFGLTPRQQTPLNAYVSLEQLQRSLDQRGRVNGLFAAAGDIPPEAIDGALRAALELEDLGLVVERAEDHLNVTSREFVLRPEVDRAVGQSARELGLPMMRTQSYLANAMRVGERLLPYSLVAALDPIAGQPWALLETVDGASPAAASDGGILLGAWAAEDLGAAVGDTVAMEYYAVGAAEALIESEVELRVEGVVAMSGLAADRSLTPDYPGIQEAEDISNWDPPFPVDLGVVRPEDEAYWDAYRATPKAFVSEETGRRLWATRFGTTTAVRIGTGGGDPAAVERRLRQALAARLSPDAFGLRFEPVLERGLKAAAGATDFAMLFVSFSFFLILSAALLIGLLFRLGVEQRAGEIGLLLAVGYRLATVRRLLLAEGGLLAAVGAAAGLAAGTGFAGLMMAGLRTVWRPAVGSTELYLHVEPASLAAGWGIAVAVVLVTVFFAVRKLVRIPSPQLLAGSLSAPARPRAGRTAAFLVFGGLLGALGLAATAVVTGAMESPGLAFGSGALLLIGGLALFSRWCRGSRRRGVTRLGGMAARNSSWNPGRSILSVALVGSACFMIVVVEVFRVEPGHALEEKDSAAGGFALVAEADVGLQQSLNRPAGRFDLGFSDAESEILDAATVYGFRTLAGDDTSCLNLYRPERPRLLGITPEFVERGGFRFQKTIERPEGLDPWRLLQQPLEEGVIPAVADVNSATWILKLGLGDELTMDDEAGRPVRLRLVGMLAKGILQSELLISEENLLEHFPGQTGDAYFLIEAPGDRSAEIAQLLESRLAPFGFDATTTRERLAGFEVVNNTYLSTFQVLGGLGLLLGTIGLGIVLVRSVIERRGELATLRAFGFRRSTLAWMVLAENAFLLLVGMGIGASAAAVAVAPRIAVGQIPWPSLLATLVVVALVGMLSCVAAVLGTLRVPLLPALKAER